MKITSFVIIVFLSFVRSQDYAEFAKMQPRGRVKKANRSSNIFFLTI
jgi:hypothetical protein